MSDHSRWVEATITEVRIYRHGRDVADSEMAAAGIDPAGMNALERFLQKDLSDPEGFMGDGEGPRHQADYHKDSHTIIVTITAP
jgi:hypothetical protein